MRHPCASSSVGARYLLVPGLIAGGLALAIAERRHWRVRWIPVVCVELLLLCLLGLSHISARQGLADALLGHRGGLVGWGISGFLLTFLPSLIVWLVLILAAIAALAVLVLSLPSDWSRSLLSPWRARAADRWPGSLAGRLGRMIPLLGRTGGPDDEPVVTAPIVSTSSERTSPKSKDLSRRRQPRSAQPVKRPDWLPPLDLLRPDPDVPGPAAGGAYSANTRQRAQLIKQTLAEFGVPVEVVSIKEGPTVTQFGLEPGEMVRELRTARWCAGVSRCRASCG